MDITELGASIRRARLTAGLTQAQLADRLGTTQSVVARWERGRAEPRLSTVMKIGAATGAWVEFDIRPGIEDGEWSIVEGNLRLSPEQRLRRLADTVQFIQRGRTAMKEARSA